MRAPVAADRLGALIRRHSTTPSRLSVLLVALLAALGDAGSAAGQPRYEVLAAFENSALDGAHPSALVEGFDGSVYGDDRQRRFGKRHPGNGAFPRVVQATDLSFYGTTSKAMAAT